MNVTNRHVDVSKPRLNGEAIDRVAQEKGWTNVDEIVDGIGLGNRATYYRYLKGELDLSLTTARRIASRAGLPLDVVFPPTPTKAA